VGVVGISRESLENRAIIRDSLNKDALHTFQGDHVLVGRRLADHMGVKVGDRLLLMTPEGTDTAFGQVPRQKAFVVGGIFEVGMHDFDKNILFMPLDTAQSLFKMTGHISHMEVFTSHAELAPHLAHVLQQALAQEARVLDWQHGDSQIFHAVQVERNVMFLILTLIILIASFNIISSLIMLVKDKTRHIAILRTMGASRLSLMRIFFLTGASIGVVGTVLGVGLGLGFALNIEAIRQFLQGLTGTELFSAEIYFLSQLPAKVDWAEVGTVVTMALALSFLATLYPAWRAARLDPVEALRG
jgi:lipoprotein-releasing system permease protein